MDMVPGRCVAIMRKSIAFNEIPEVEYNPFPDMGGCAKLPWVRRGLRFTVSLRTGVIFIGGRKTADFLGGQRSGTPTSGGILAGMFGNLSAAQKFFHR